MFIKPNWTTSCSLCKGKIIPFISGKVWPPETTLNIQVYKVVNNLFHDFLQGFGRETVTKCNEITS